MADYDYIDTKNDDGSVIGQKTTSLIGFWGCTPCDQATALTTALTALTVVSATAYTTAIRVTSTSFFGWDTYDEYATALAVVQNVQKRLGDVEDKLVECGLLAGGTAAPTPTQYDYIGKGADDGTIFGQASTTKIGFWGITPCDQPAALTAALTTIELTTTVSTTTYVYAIPAPVTSSAGYGFESDDMGSTMCQAIQNLHARILQVETNLVEAGIIAGGTAISITTSNSINFRDSGNDDGTIVLATTTHKLGFWGTTPCDQPAALTAALTTITLTCTTYDYAWAEVTITGFVFANATVGDTFIAVVVNTQTRLGELEARLEECGLIAAN